MKFTAWQIQAVTIGVVVAVSTVFLSFGFLSLITRHDRPDRAFDVYLTGDQHTNRSLSPSSSPPAAAAAAVTAKATTQVKKTKPPAPQTTKKKNGKTKTTTPKQNTITNSTTEGFVVFNEKFGRLNNQLLSFMKALEVARLLNMTMVYRTQRVHALFNFAELTKSRLYRMMHFDDFKAQVLLGRPIEAEDMLCLAYDVGVLWSHCQRTSPTTAYWGVKEHSTDTTGYEELWSTTLPAAMRADSSLRRRIVYVGTTHMHAAVVPRAWKYLRPTDHISRVATSMFYKHKVGHSIGVHLRMLEGACGKFMTKAVNSGRRVFLMPKNMSTAARWQRFCRLERSVVDAMIRDDEVPLTPPSTAAPCRRVDDGFLPPVAPSNRLEMLPFCRHRKQARARTANVTGARYFVTHDGSKDAVRALASYGRDRIDLGALSSLKGGADARAVLDMWLLAYSRVFIGNPVSSFTVNVMYMRVFQGLGSVQHPHQAMYFFIKNVM